MESYSNKNCYYHHDEELKYICLDCDKQPICSDCLTDGQLHSNHKMTKTLTDNIIDVVDDLKTNIYPLIKKLLKENEIIKKKCETFVKESENEKDKDLKLIKDEFKHIHLFIQMAELDLENDIKKNHNNNIKIQSSILSEITNEKNILDLILSNNETDLSKMKDYQQSNIILKKSKQEKIDLLNQFNINTIEFKKEKTDSLKKSLDGLYIINEKSIEAKKIDYNGQTYYEYYKGMKITNEMKGIAFGARNDHCFNLFDISKSNNIEHIMLLDGFNGEIPKLPKSINTLHIGNISKPIKNGSIPSTVTKIGLHNGFNQELEPNFLPSSVTALWVGDIKHPLKAGSIPSTITKIELMNGFNQELKPGVLPNSVSFLSIGCIKHPLNVGSIPPNATWVQLMNGFDQKLESGVLPAGVSTLRVGLIKHSLKNISIPPTVTKIYLDKGFNHELDKHSILNNVTALYIGKIKHPLKVQSIPSTVTFIELMNGFDHPLEPGVLPNGLINLKIGEIEYPIKVGSIPSTVRSVQLMNKFNHELEPGVLPNGIITLSIGDIKHPLKVGTIPPTVKILKLFNGFKQELKPELLPKSITTIYFDQSIKLESMSPSIKLIQH